MDLSAGAALGAGALHLLSRGMVGSSLLFAKSCRSVSLISQELFLIVYVCRYLDLLYLYTSFVDTLCKIAKIAAALAIVLVIRYSPNVAETVRSGLIWAV